MIRLRGKAVQALIGILIAAGAMYVFLRGTDTNRLLSELRSTSPAGIIASICLTMLSMIIRSLRWRVMLPDIPGAHKRNLFSHTIIGFMINNIVPARAGEAVRILLLWRKNRYPLAVSAGTLILERIIDTMVFLLLFAIPVFTLDILHTLKPVGLFFAAAFAASTVFLAALGFYPQIVSGFIRRMSFIVPRKLLNRVDGISRDAASVLTWIRSPVKSVLVILLSIGVWSSSAASVVVLARCHGLFGFWHGTFVLSFAGLGAAIPLAPGFVGTLHAAVLQAFILLGWNADSGRAMALLIHAAGYVPITLVGFIYFFRADMSFKEASSAGEIIHQ
jgi:uncharacterized protein (TIRG00374 family)